ncbi:MAG: hypothetical protein AAGC80_23660, partial [Rhodococcus sp. (in: high G+C Gram-positive bacteria)]
SFRSNSSMRLRFTLCVEHRNALQPGICDGPQSGYLRRRLLTAAVTVDGLRGAARTLGAV